MPYYRSLQIRGTKIAPGYKINPMGVTTDDLIIYANQTDTTPKIVLNGAGAIELVSGGTAVIFKYGVTDAGYVNMTATTFGLVSYSNRDIDLIPNGTGVVKFGTYTAGAATDSTGYITIKDAAGNTRKLMIQA
jgi:hypothetical protein